METVGERLKKGVGWCTIKRFAPGLGAGMERGEETLSENKDHSTRTISVVMAITLLGKVLACSGIT